MKKLSISAPATLMICGEHAVVQGEPALVGAINQRAEALLTPRNDKKINIFSDLAQHQTHIETLTDHPQLKFVMACIRKVQPRQGFDLEIKSEINPTMGFGSSSAVTVATLAVLKQEFELLELHAEALSIIHEIQKRGSGADLAGAIWGGLIAYSPPKNQSFAQVERLNFPDLSLSVRYAGYKTPTAEVLALIAQRQNKNPQYFKELYAQMGEITRQAIHHAKQENWADFYQKLNIYQNLMEDLGVCDAVQRQHIQEALQRAKASKISGSGLGDCILAFAEVLPAEHLSVQWDNQGLKVVHFSAD